MSPKQTPNTQSAGEELFNSVISEINPALLTTSSVNIDEKKQGETEQEYEIRIEGYQNDFNEGARRLDLLEQGKAIHARMDKEENRTSLHKQEEQERKGEIDQVEQEFNSFGTA